EPRSVQTPPPGVDPPCFLSNVGLAWGGKMTTLHRWRFGAISLALVLAAAAAPLSAQQGDTAQVAIDSDDIGGVVSSPTGPEAGVWVIAETTLGEFKSGEEAWIRRVQSGQAAENMVNPLGALGGLPFKYFGDWTDRVARGELPHAKPKRPEGVERNIVVTSWEWG